MNGIQGCVYIVSRAADLSQARSRDEIHTAHKELNDQKVLFFRAAGQKRAQEYKLSAYAYRMVDDDEQGKKKFIIDECAGNSSTVLIDAEHLPNIRHLLFQDVTIQSIGSQVFLYENGGFKDLFVLQATDLLST